MRRELRCRRLGDRPRLGLLRLPAAEVPVGRCGGGGGRPVADDGPAAARVGRSGRVGRGGLLVEDDGAGAAEKREKGKVGAVFPFAAIRKFDGPARGAGQRPARWKLIAILVASGGSDAQQRKERRGEG